MDESAEFGFHHFPGQAGGAWPGHFPGQPGGMPAGHFPGQPHGIAAGHFPGADGSAGYHAWDPGELSNHHQVKLTVIYRK